MADALGPCPPLKTALEQAGECVGNDAVPISGR